LTAQNVVLEPETPAIESRKNPFQLPPNESLQLSFTLNGFVRDAVISAPSAVFFLVVCPWSVPTKGVTLPWNTVPFGASTRTSVAAAGPAAIIAMNRVTANAASN